MNKIKKCFIGMIIMFAIPLFFSNTINAEEGNRFVVDSFDPATMLYVEPITEIECNGEVATFEYSSNGMLLSKEFDSDITLYENDDCARIVGVSTNDYCMEFIFDNSSKFGKCKGLICGGAEYSFDYDLYGNVYRILDSSKNVICSYDYGDMIAIPQVILGNQIDSVDEIVAFNNPYRFQGMFYMSDINLYYLGDGVFYDPIQELFVQNDYELTECGIDWIMEVANQKSLTYDQINYIVGQYNSAMSNAAYGASTYSNPSYYNWLYLNQRWYTNVSPLEVVARCIYAESTYPNRSDDRTGIAAAIMNRRVSNNMTAYNVVIDYNQFYTINPPYDHIDETDGARVFKSKTDSVWQQATLLACVDMYANATSDIGYFYSIPSGITSQKNFRGLDGVSISYNNGLIYVAGAPRTNIAIAGYGVIDTLSEYNYMASLQGYGYTVFFD